MRAPLLLTGGPASGKSTTSRRLAEGLPRAAVVDVDDIRQLVTSGHAAPWDGAEGARQHRLGIENACDLARRFAGAGIDVVLSDVVGAGTALLYRRLLPSLTIVRLVVSFDEARRRAALRPAFLTAAEFESLHRREAAAPAPADHTLDVEALDVEGQARAVERLWPVAVASTGRQGGPR